MQAERLTHARKFSIAPMMDWTDRHCRYLHRQLTRRALLFTEMVTAPAIIHGDRQRLLGFDPIEHPVAVQLGGSDPGELAAAVGICDEWGYDEINLNVGCPSDRVKSGRFGACLMAEPALVADLVRAMKQATEKPVTVKCRIGIDDQDSERDFNIFADAMVEAGADALYVHARKAWLEGLSPKENRDVPPLDYPRVYRLAARLKPYPVYVNGGITTLDEAQSHLQHVDGVMLGRAAYHDPRILAEVDTRIFGEPARAFSLAELARTMTEYAVQHQAQGGRLNHVTRHMLGLGNGLPGARRFRQILSVDAVRDGAGPEVIENAFAALDEAALAVA